MVSSFEDLHLRTLRKLATSSTCIGYFFPFYLAGRFVRRFWKGSTSLFGLESAHGVERFEGAARKSQQESISWVSGEVHSLLYYSVRPGIAEIVKKEPLFSRCDFCGSLLSESLNFEF